MAEDNEFLRVEPAAFVASDDMEQTVVYDQNERLSDRQAVFTPESGSVDQTTFVVGAQQSINVTNPAGPTALFTASATGPRKPKTGVIERSLIDPETGPTTEVATWTASSPGMTQVPFEVNGTSTYQIALRNNVVPSEPRLKLDGQRTWLRWEHALGERRSPLSVAEQAIPGSGLRLTMTAAGELAPWSNPAATRDVRVWYHPGTANFDGAPLVTTSEAYYDGQLESDGVSVWVDVPHYFGVAAPGDHTAAYYDVHIYGFSINDRAIVDYTTITTLGVRRYLVLAEFDSLAQTISYAEQLTVESLAELSVCAKGIGALWKAFRSGAAIGSAGDTADWNDSSNVVQAVGASFATFTFGNPFTGAVPADHYICTGANEGPTAGQEPTVSSTFRSGGLVASLPVSTGAGTYAIVAYIDASGSLYLVCYTPALNAAFERQFLVVATFDWDGAAITAYYPRDLNARRGIAWGTLIGSGQEANGDHLTVHDVLGTQVGDDTLINLFGLDGASPRNAQKFGRLRLNNTGWPDSFVEMDLNPHLATAGDLDANEHARIFLGNLADDYVLTAYGAAASAAKYLEVLSAGVAALSHLRSGGLGVGAADRIQARDYHLTSGKDVWHIAPIEAGVTHSGDGGWRYNTDATPANIDACSWQYSNRNIVEKWLNATDYDSDLGDFRVQTILANDQHRFTFAIPRDAAYITGLELVVIPTGGAAGAGKSITLNSDYGQPGELYTNHSASNTATYTIPAADTIFTLSLLPVFGSVAANDQCGVEVDHNAIGGSMYYLGVRIRYLPQPYDPTYPQALDIPLGPLAAAAGSVPTGLANTLRDVRVWAQASNAGGVTSNLGLQLYDVDGPGAAITAVAGAAATVTNGAAAAWHALTPSAPVTIQRGHRYLVRAVPSVPDDAWTVVRHVEYQVRHTQLP